MADNRLGDQTSPYLLQHADNPVAWRPWGPEALAEARAANKPILLSIGYAACHWCHVMAHESFENDSIAELMNRHFVNIKVDREERPDIDHIYQTALALMGQQGGWPLTMFLTPDGEPFWGGTYFPATPKYGRPGFADILVRIAELYREQADAVEQNRAAIVERLTQIASAETHGALPPELPDRAADLLLRHVDPVNGGLGGAPKFPQSFLFEFLWRARLRTGEARFAEAVTRSLDHIAQGGIYDHLGGGFARYTVDERWLVPHFEKMLYDNALLVRLFTLVWQETGRPLYAERVAETMDWLAREMLVEGGGFASSFDADSEGVEGKFYVWTAQEIVELLPADDARLFMEIYGVAPGGNWEGVTILNRLGALERQDEDIESRLAVCRRILFEARGKRVPPGRDDKVLADWNGLMIAAAARAAYAFVREDWLALARRAFDFVVRALSAPDGRLNHATRAGRVQQTSLLDDHAHMIAAALSLHEVTGEPAFLDRAVRWADHVEAHFLDSGRGGYFTTAADGETLIVRSRGAHDSAQPSANGMMADNLARLHLLIGDDRFLRRAEALVEAFGGEAARNPVAVIGLLNGYDTLANGLSVTLVGDPPPAPLDDALRIISLPAGVRRLVPDTKALPAGDPAAAAPARPGSALVCARQTCSLPLDDPEALAAEVRARRYAPAAATRQDGGGDEF